MNEFRFMFWAVVTVFALGALSYYYEYQAVKKYYPKISFVDYVILSDKLRITPDERP